MSPIILDPPGVDLWSGSTSVYLPGSEISLSAGLESLYTYGGVTLNDRSVHDAYVLTKIEGLDDADLRFAEDDAPGDDGTIPRRSFAGGRTIVLTGYVRSGNLAKLRDMSTALQLIFSRKTEAPLYVSSPRFPSGQFYVNCRKSQKLVIPEEQTPHGQSFRRDFMVTLRASNPRKFLLEAQYDVVSDTLSGGAWSDVLYPYNRGTYTAQPILRFYSESGATDINLTNQTNGMSLTIDEIPAGHFYEMDVDSKTIYDDAAANARQHFSGSTKYVLYEPGSNVVAVSVGAGSGQFYVTSTFDPAFI